MERREIGKEDTARLWHHESHARSLGCTGCPELKYCGGLAMEFGAMSCLQFCCGKPDSCDLVCVKNPDFVSRMLEVKGPQLSIPKLRVTPCQPLPLVAPLLYHPYRRQRELDVEAVALNLYDLISWKTTSPKFHDRLQLAKRYGFDAGARVVLDGVKQDVALERLWATGLDEVVEALLPLQPDLVTTPNFSLFLDVPRWTNLTNLKRIAILWHGFASRGLPTALHINAITDRDYERWAVFLKHHEEIEVISFEFGTGAGHTQRAPWHVKQLARLTSRVHRPLQLVVRGARRLAELADYFRSITVIDTSSFTKAVRRRRAIGDHSGRLYWASVHTRRGEPLDDLLAHNVAVVRQFIERSMSTSKKHVTYSNAAI